MHMRKTCGLVILGLALTCRSVFSADTVAVRRQQVLVAGAKGPAGLAALQSALEDESPLVRRPAIRALVALGASAHKALAGALSNTDPVVRRAALLALVGRPTQASLPMLAQGLTDEDPGVRQSAVGLLVVIEPRTDEALGLLRQAANDKATEVQMPAALALAASGTVPKTFSVPPPDRVPLRQRPDMMDQISRIESALTVPLPRDGWRFRVDPAKKGHLRKWSDAAHDDSTWGEMPIGAFWNPEYIGVAWYRRRLELPDRPEHLAAELVFEAVDETAWVWVNGAYVGGQDIGSDGWDKPFRVDVTEQLRWNSTNQITVRVLNTAFAGGIWKPVRIDALKLK